MDLKGSAETEDPAKSPAFVIGSYGSSSSEGTNTPIKVEKKRKEKRSFFPSPKGTNTPDLKKIKSNTLPKSAGDSNENQEDEEEGEEEEEDEINMDDYVKSLESKA